MTLMHVMPGPQSYCRPGESGVLGCQPDEAGEAPCARGTTVRVETRIAEGAQPATVDRMNANSRQTDTCKPVEVRHETPGVDTWHKGCGSGWMLCQECLAHLGADLEYRRPDRRPQPGEHLTGRNRQCLERCFENAASQPPPTSMRSRDTGRRAITEQYRQAVGGQYRTGQARRLAPAGIGSRAISRSSLDSHARMHLLQPDWLATEHILKVLAIPGHRGRLITNVVTQIEAVERGTTDTAPTRGDTGADIGRGRPFGQQPVLAPAAHPTNASRSCCSKVSSQTKSSGSGDSHFILCPVTG